MGRRRIHKTPEEQATAKRLYSKRYYNKNKETINETRRSDYHRQRERIASSSTIQYNELKQEKSMTREQKIEAWMEQGRRVQRRFQKWCNNNPKELLESIYQRCIKDDVMQMSIEDSLSYIVTLQNSIDRFQDEILNLSGVGAALEELQAIGACITTTRNWVDELFCFTALGHLELKKMYDSCQLGFQIS
ncbi:hypothetical protein CPC08DRAFT_769838 [Agrocybe pediades]|nr:hypothetical protein CPC08DRAFT_769838 [Agrocybe pediades]